jgi:hypothetical protein
MMASGEIDGRFIPVDRFAVPDDFFASQPIRVGAGANELLARS